MKSIPLNDESTFELISGLWKGERGRLARGRVIRATNFSCDGALDFDEVVELDVEERHFNQRQLVDGDIVVERSGGGPKQPVGRIAIFKKPDDAAYFSSNFTTSLRVRDRTVFNSDYVAFFLHALYLRGDTRNLQRATTGLRNLDWQAYLQFEVPVIPIDEQEAISKVLLEARLAYQLEEKLTQTFRMLKRASLTQLFSRGLRREPTRDTEFGSVPDSWIETPLSDCSDIQTGATKGRKLDGSEISVPYLRVANVQDGHLDLSHVKEIPIRENEVERYRLRPGDVVLTEGGDFDKLGRGFIWRGEIELCVHQNHIFAVRPDPKRMTPEFFAYLAQSSYGKSYFLKVAHKTTNLASINSTKLKAFPVPVPPTLDEQREITGILEAIDEKIALHEQKSGVIEDIFRSLLHKLVAGHLNADQLDLSPLPS